MNWEPWSLAVCADTASAETRERLVRWIESAGPERHGWVRLHTCHRVEVYGFGPVPELPPEMILRRGDDAVVHLLRVAAGLESAVIGEDEVLHQVREAHAAAMGGDRRDIRLHRLFEVAIAAGRRARTGRTAANAGLATRALEWLSGLVELDGSPLLVVGAGQMGSALAHAAAGAGARVTIASRDPLKAWRLACVYGGNGISLAEGAAIAAGSSGVAVALGGEWEELAELDQSLPPIADISAPSAVPALVRARLDGGYLGIDDLFNRDRPLPVAYIRQAERVVEQKAAEYASWLGGRR